MRRCDIERISSRFWNDGVKSIQYERKKTKQTCLESLFCQATNDTKVPTTSMRIWRTHDHSQVSVADLSKIEKTNNANKCW